MPHRSWIFRLSPFTDNANVLPPYGKALVASKEYLANDKQAVLMVHGCWRLREEINGQSTW
eukprot:10419829-Prorocentrum_lima.AAC.1